MDKLDIRHLQKIVENARDAKVPKTYLDFFLNARVYAFDLTMTEFINHANAKGRQSLGDFVTPFPRVLFYFRKYKDDEYSTFDDSRTAYHAIGLDSLTHDVFLISFDRKLGISRASVAMKDGHPLAERQRQDLINVAGAIVDELSNAQPSMISESTVHGFFRGKLKRGRATGDLLGIVNVTIPKPDTQSIGFNSMEKQIDWQHRWEVAGHWRRVRGEGHAPDGSLLAGRTWVRSHTKGPEDKPLVVKERRVKVNA